MANNKNSNFNKLNIQNCKFCGKECKNTNSLKNHQTRCKFNPNVKLIGFSSSEWKAYIQSDAYSPWNKGLTKYSDERVKRASINISKSSATHTGRASTFEKEVTRRQRISDSMRKNPKAGGLRHGSGRGKKGWYKGFFCDSTYELVYVIYNLDNGIKFKRNEKFYEYEYNGSIHKYYPDFILEDGSFVELKGYHTDLVDLKIQSVTDKPIKILYKKDLEYAFDYVKSNYTYNKLQDLYE